VRKEVPLIAHRVRQAAVKRGARVAMINPRRHEVRFPTVAQLTSNGLGMAQHLAGVLLAATSAAGRSVPAHLSSAVQGVSPSADHGRIAEALGQGELRVILLGAIAQNHAAYSEIRALARALAEVTGARLGFLPEGGNAVGAALAGVTPHRGVGGIAVRSAGLSAGDMINAKLRAYVLVGGVEPEDLAVPGRAETALAGADCVVALSPYADERLRSLATVILPIAAFAETSGTWINVEGTWQSVPGAARPPGEARPAWKVLRVLGNLLGISNFDYASSEEVRDELRRLLGEYRTDTADGGTFSAGLVNAVDTVREVGLYEVDAIVRRSKPLQETREAREARGGSN
jgi:NADH-quinone oxidoreductase subunit G